MSPELVSGIARVAHEKLLSVLTECGTKKTKGTCLFASYLVCYLAKTKGLDAVVRGVTVQMMAVYLQRVVALAIIGVN